MQTMEQLKKELDELKKVHKRALVFLGFFFCIKKVCMLYECKKPCSECVENFIKHDEYFRQDGYLN